MSAKVEPERLANFINTLSPHNLHRGVEAIEAFAQEVAREAVVRCLKAIPHSTGCALIKKPGVGQTCNCWAKECWEPIHAELTHGAGTEPPILCCVCHKPIPRDSNYSLSAAGLRHEQCHGLPAQPSEAAMGVSQWQAYGRKFGYAQYFDGLHRETLMADINGENRPFTSAQVNWLRAAIDAEFPVESLRYSGEAGGVEALLGILTRLGASSFDVDNVSVIFGDAQQAAITNYLTSVYGPRCETPDTVDFPEIVGDPKASRCVNCQAWETYDSYLADVTDSGEGNQS